MHIDFKYTFQMSEHTRSLWTGRNNCGFIWRRNFFFFAFGSFVDKPSIAQCSIRENKWSVERDTSRQNYSRRGKFFYWCRTRAKSHEVYTLGSEADSSLHTLLAVQHAQDMCKLKTDKNPSKDVVMVHEASFPVKKLYAIDECSELDSPFSLRVWFQVYWLWSTDWPHAQVLHGQHKLVSMTLREMNTQNCSRRKGWIYLEWVKKKEQSK